MIKIGLGQRERLLDSQPRAPEHHDQGVDAMPMAIVPGLAHDRDDLIDRRRVRRVGLTLIARGNPGTRSWRGRRRTASTSSVKQLVEEHGRNPARQFIASLDGQVVGTAAAVLGNYGINLFAAGVLPDARGRGVYRAMIRARWDLAVERGTPALTVQAGQMSRPVLESAGFSFIAAARMYVSDSADCL